MDKPTPARPECQLCQQFGFDADSRRERLLLMGLDASDQTRMHQLQQQAIQPHIDQIMEGFYAFLLGFAEMRRFLGTAEHIQRLKTTQREYLSSFGIGFSEPAYFDYRLRIGIAHERIGIPMHLYLAAYRQLEQLIWATLPPPRGSDTVSYLLSLQTISKVVMLDMSLAIDTYTRNRVAGLAESITNLAQERDTLTNQLMHDTLTGTLSRRFILETLAKQLAQLSRLPERQLCIALLDLDNFKQVNDQFGHLVGDKVLYEFCRVVTSRLREQDYFGRFGGEEFLLLITDMSGDKAHIVLDRIREATQEQIFTHQGKRIPLTVSIGWTIALPSEKVDDLIERADSALYRAKQAGRNQVVSR